MRAFYGLKPNGAITVSYADQTVVFSALYVTLAGKIILEKPDGKFSGFKYLWLAVWKRLNIG